MNPKIYRLCVIECVMGMISAMVLLIVVIMSSLLCQQLTWEFVMWWWASCAACAAMTSFNKSAKKLQLRLDE